MESGFVSCATVFGVKITTEELEAINITGTDKQCTNEEASIYLFGSAKKNGLSESPFIRY